MPSKKQWVAVAIVTLYGAFALRPEPYMMLGGAFMALFLSLAVVDWYNGPREPEIKPLDGDGTE